MFRVHNSFTGRAESAILRWLCRHLPRPVTSDLLTLIGVIGATIFLLSFWLSQFGKIWLWLAILGIVINWLGDSLDGTLARHRQVERPKYGFFLDHMADTVSMGLIGIGFGLSPYVHLAIAMMALLAYYLLAILSFVTCIVTGVFRISFNGVGPTEVRLLIIGLTFSIILLPDPGYVFGPYLLSAYDIVVIVIGIAMAGTAAIQAVRTARDLSIKDPARLTSPAPPRANPVISKRQIEADA